MQEFQRDMRVAKLSPVTIHDRIAVIERLRRFLNGKPLLDADHCDLHRFQQAFGHLAPASVDIYTRHVQAFFRWAHGRDIIGADPAKGLIKPRLPKGRPHPMTIGELELILSVASPVLRLVFVLAAFAGLRRGEICALQRRDLELDARHPVALIHGKGNRERIVPLLLPVVAELQRFGLARAGYVVLKHGRAYPPGQLSVDVYQFLRGIGVESSLHSARHFFCTHAARMTRDPMFIRDLAGHQSVQTTEIYMESDMSDAHRRLGEFAAAANRMLSGQPQLHVVSGGER